MAEILASEGRNSLDYQSQVFRVRDHYVVTYGIRTSVQQGENMLFCSGIHQHPYPKVYAIFHDEVSGQKVNLILMEYIPRVMLDRAWARLGASEKRDIVSQLRRHMDELRSIPSPGYYGGVWRQQLRDIDFERRADGLIYSAPEISGPHETEEQFVDGIWQCFDRAAAAHYEELSARRGRYLA